MTFLGMDPPEASLPPETPVEKPVPENADADMAADRCPAGEPAHVLPRIGD